MKVKRELKPCLKSQMVKKKKVGGSEEKVREKPNVWVGPKPPVFGFLLGRLLSVSILWVFFPSLSLPFATVAVNSTKVQKGWALPPSITWPFLTDGHFGARIWPLRPESAVSSRGSQSAELSVSKHFWLVDTWLCVGRTLSFELRLLWAYDDPPLCTNRKETHRLRFREQQTRTCTRPRGG